MKYVNDNNPVVADLCKKHKVSKLYSFESEWNPQDDIELLVDFNGVDVKDYATNYFDLEEALSKALGHQVFLASDKYVKNPVRKRNIERTKMLIYE
jgi:predicted nucleotidyltransferase